MSSQFCGGLNGSGSIKLKILRMKDIKELQNECNTMCIVLNWGIKAETTFFGEWGKIPVFF
jgi:hypothetical protein